MSVIRCVYGLIRQLTRLHLAVMLAAVPVAAVADSHATFGGGVIQMQPRQQLAPIAPQQGTRVMTFECKDGECSCNDLANGTGDCDNMRRLNVCAGSLTCNRDHWGYEYCSCKMR